jgi:protein-disulfide isomerase
MQKLLLCILVILYTQISNATNYYGEIDDDIAIGSNNAKVVIIEYSSLTCPHCSEFHNRVFPALEEKYINTGKVRFIHRNSFHPKDLIALRAAMIPFCAKDRYYTLLKVLYKTQKNWLFESTKNIDVISDISRLGGMSAEEFNQCINDKIVEDKILTSQLVAVNELKIEGTPTFIINGNIYRGYLTKNKLFEIIEEQLNIAVN